MTSPVTVSDALIARLVQAACNEEDKRHYAYAALLTQAADTIHLLSTDVGQARLAALDEAAEVAYRRLFPSNPKSDWTQFAKDMAYMAKAARDAILALKETPDAK